jgi:hypothetical protein
MSNKHFQNRQSKNVFSISHLPVTSIEPNFYTLYVKLVLGRQFVRQANYKGLNAVSKFTKLPQVPTTV